LPDTSGHVLGRPLFPLKNAHSRAGICTPSNTRFLRPTAVHIPNGISISSVIFAQLTAGSPYTLQWPPLFPFKIAPSHGGSGYPSSTWFLGPAGDHIPNDISIGSAFFAGITIVTDRQTELTDQQTDNTTLPVTTDRIYLMLRCGLKAMLHDQLKMPARLFQLQGSQSNS